MQFKSVFPILIAHGEIAAQSVAGVRLRQIQQALQADGWHTLVVDNEADAGIVAGAQRGRLCRDGAQGAQAAAVR